MSVFCSSGARASRRLLARKHALVVSAGGVHPRALSRSSAGKPVYTSARFSDPQQSPPLLVWPPGAALHIRSASLFSLERAARSRVATGSSSASPLPLDLTGVPVAASVSVYLAHACLLRLV